MNKMTNILTALGIGAVCSLALGNVASASPISYEGTLSSGVIAYGQVAEPEGGSNDDFWSFFGNAGDAIDIVVHRLENALDPGFHLYSGFGDTDSLTQLLFQDDEIAELAGYDGPWSDPAVFSYSLPFTGLYTVRVVSVASGSAGEDGVYDYQILASNVQPVDTDVPEPATLALLGTGLLGLGLMRRRRR